MRKIALFSIRSFIGPFIVTFCIAMFMLVMQFLWKYIDDLIGKGLGFFVILELFVYVSASLIPLALPLSMLLSSIMTLGNFAENNELTALKSSGLSLFKILRPLAFVVVGFSCLTFMFSNYIIPAANIKWHSLIYDIQETKIASILKPGVYSTVIDGYAIKIKEGNDAAFKDIIIHDHTDLSVTKTIKAKSGEVFKGNNSSYLLFMLKDGNVVEELSSNSVENYNNATSNNPSRRSSFKKAIYKINVSGFSLKRSDESLFKNEYEMWNVFQINDALDSLQHTNLKLKKDFTNSLKYNLSYFQATKDSSLNKNIGQFKVKELDTKEKKQVYQQVISKLRRSKQGLASQQEFLKTFSFSLTKFVIEFNKKFSLTFAVLILFFVGAPLGAIVKKGGFGTPVVIAALLFLVYYVLTEIGINLAESGVTSPFIGVWLANYTLAPVAFLLMRSAASDISLFDKKFWKLKL